MIRYVAPSTPICASASPPIPMTFPVTSWIGFSVVSSTSATRLDFSSRTPIVILTPKITIRT
jgi:hypothetical protein